MQGRAALNLIELSCSLGRGMAESTAIIRFLCPRGHKLSVAEERAGRVTKCPECDTLFQVPSLGDVDSPPGVGVLQAVEVVEFLCPNGHYLQGPVKLEGTRGQCPHCGEKFQIPLRDDEHDEDGADGDEADRRRPATTEVIEAIPVDDDPETEVDPEAEADTEVEAEEIVEEIVEVAGPYDADAKPPVHAVDFGVVGPQQPALVALADVDVHPLAALFERIWEQSDPEAIIELHLDGGQVVTPVHFSHELSRGQHGVFAALSADGKHAVTIVAWNNVSRVTVRGLNELPPGMFD